MENSPLWILTAKILNESRSTPITRCFYAATRYHCSFQRGCFWLLQLGNSGEIGFCCFGDAGMKNTYLLQLPQQTLECKLLYSARKTLAIEIKLNAEIIIRAPKKVKDAQIINFVESKKDWIVEKRQIAVQRKLERKPGFHFQNGKSYSCLGRQLMILGPEDVLTEQQKKAAAEAIVLRLKTNDGEKVHLTAVK